MRTPGVFLAGVLVGAAIGVGVMLALTPPARQTTDDPDARQADADSGDRRTENDREHATLGAGDRGVAPEHSEPSDPTVGSAGGTGTVEPEAPTKYDAFRAALDDVRAKLTAVRAADPGSQSVLDLLAEFRKLMGHSDPPIARLGARALIRLAGWEKLTDPQVTALAEEFGTLEPGTAARTGLAGAVALAWASDARLAGWFERLPTVDEPEIRATVVEALDESASAPYREYLLRLSRTERSSDVLESAWHEDPITVAMTKSWAPRLIAAIEPRVAEGDLTPGARGRALFAIGLAAVHESAAANAAIERLLYGEANAGVHAFGDAILAAIEREEANVQTLDRLWAEHRRSFGEE